MNRRKFIRQTTLTSVGFLALSRCNLQSGHQQEKVAKLKLISDPKKYLDLPEGFSYKIISKSGQPMSDGFLVPGRPDGMGTFLNDQQQTVVIRNHENSPVPLQNSPFGPDNALLEKVNAEMLYDAGQGVTPGLGGTTTLIYDEQKGEVVKEYLSLAGTYRNCAGGVTPWGSWLTCEEDVTRANGKNVEQDHGYVFEVAAKAPGLVTPRPIKAMGRFNHEAVAVDAKTNIVYMTEDQSDGLIYRYIPVDKNDLHQGGQLQVLAIKGQKSLDTRNWKQRLVKVNTTLQTEWLSIDEPLSPTDDANR